MRVIGLDIGEKRIGIAVSDPHGRVATPVKIVDAARPGDLVAEVREWEPGLVVVGLPLSMAGGEGPQARHVRDVVAGFTPALGAPVAFFDERLTSAQAERAMANAGLTQRERRGKVDMLAAALMLQAYLDTESTDDA